MVINISVQYNGGLLPDIMITGCERIETKLRTRRLLTVLW